MNIFVNHVHLFPKDIFPEGDKYHLLKLMYFDMIFKIK